MIDQIFVPADHLVRVVRGNGLMCRTGVLLLASGIVGRETDVAARLNLDPLDYAEWKQDQIEEGQRCLDLTWQGLLGDLDAICELPTPTDCLLVFNFDLALSYLEDGDRKLVWRFLRESFRKRRKGLVLAVPANASRLIRAWELEAWGREGRLARWDG